MFPIPFDPMSTFREPSRKSVPQMLKTLVEVLGAYPHSWSRVYLGPTSSKHTKRDESFASLNLYSTRALLKAYLPIRSVYLCIGRSFAFLVGSFPFLASMLHPSYRDASNPTCTCHRALRELSSD